MWDGLSARVVDMRSKLYSAAVRNSPVSRDGVPTASNGADMFNPGTLHNPVSIPGWGIAVIGGLAIWIALFVAM